MWIVYTNIKQPQVVARFKDSEEGLARVWELLNSNKNYWFWFGD